MKYKYPFFKYPQDYIDDGTEHLVVRGNIDETGKKVYWIKAHGNKTGRPYYLADDYNEVRRFKRKYGNIMPKLEDAIRDGRV